jgi:hypothetical protein
VDSSDTALLYADVDAGTGYGNAYASIPDPPPGTGHWFLLRPDCPLGSWQSGAGNDAARDTARPTTISLEYGLEVAAMEALDRWGDEAVAGEPLPTYDGNGNVSSWLIPFALSGNPLPPADGLADYIDELALTYDRTDPQFYRTIENAFGPIGTIQTGASLEDYPVLAVHNSLHAGYLYGAYAREEMLNQTGELPLTTRYVFEGPHEQYFDLFADNSFRRLHAYTMTEEHELEPLPSDDVVSGFGRQQQDWDSSADPANRGVTVNIIPFPDRMPVVDWTCWCVPTTFSMLVGYWDNLGPSGTHTGYGRAVDYWRTRACPTNTSATNIPNFMDEIVSYTNPAACTAGCNWNGNSMEDVLNTLNGYGFTYDQVDGNSGNEYAWSDLIAEIDAGRPALWGVGPQRAHAMAAYGYRIVDGTRYVVVLNTWGATRQQQQAEYNYEQWDDGKGDPTAQIGFSKVGRLTPGGPEDSHAYLAYPRGGETLFGPTNIRWVTSGVDEILRTDIYLSTNSGNSWNLITSDQPTFLGVNTFSWNASIATDQARIRIEGRTGSGELIAADSSIEDFTVDVEPDLTPIANAGGFYCRRIGSDLEVEVRNVGTATAGSSFTRVTFDDGTVTTFATPMLTPGLSTFLYFPIPPACSNPSCFFTIEVDVYGNVAESNEGNNQASETCVN